MSADEFRQLAREGVSNRFDAMAADRGILVVNAWRRSGAATAAGDRFAGLPSASITVQRCPNE